MFGQKKKKGQVKQGQGKKGKETRAVRRVKVHLERPCPQKQISESPLTPIHTQAAQAFSQKAPPLHIHDGFQSRSFDVFVDARNLIGMNTN